MKTLFFIHGGESFQNEIDYQDFLRNIYVAWQSEPWSNEENTSWKEEVGKKWQKNGGVVYMPDFPNKLNAKYEEWKVVFDGILNRLPANSEITFIGGSLGGCFLLKYFSLITEFSHKIEAIHLIAACLECGDFRTPSNYCFLETLREKVHIWHAEDDTIVPFGIGKDLAKFLPEAHTHFIPKEQQYGHFHGLERIIELEEVLFR